MIRAVTFDVGGTLIHPTPSVGHIYASAAENHGYPNIPPEQLNRRFAAAWADLKDFSHTYAQWAALVDATFDGITKEPPSQTFFHELFERFAQPDAWEIFPDAKPALEQLAAIGLKLGVVSNWDERLRPLLRDLKLDSYFHAIVVSCETGWCKPAEEIFYAAANALRLPAGQILHVGDSVEMDLNGARAAGMQAVLIRRAPAFQIRGLSREPRLRPGADLPSVNALTELAGRLSDR